MQIYSFHDEPVNGRKCAEGQSLSASATGDHLYVYTHEDGIQGGGELPEWGI